MSKTKWMFAALCLSAATQATARMPDEAFYLHASNCTAAFKARVEQHLTQAPSEARNQLLLRDTELGFVYVGLAYKRGLRNPQADDLLKVAEDRWRQLGAAQQNNRLSQCTQEGQQHMADISGLERYLVRNRAKARIDKLLAKEQAPAAVTP